MAYMESHMCGKTCINLVLVHAPMSHCGKAVNLVTVIEQLSHNQWQRKNKSYMVAAEVQMREQAHHGEDNIVAGAR